MKALTICQPYAELIARGTKRVENREWPTRYRGVFYIHAGKSREWMNDDGFVELDYDILLSEMQFGAVIAIAELVDCLPYDTIMDGLYGSKYPWLRKHEHTNGPWCWIIGSVKRVVPVPWKGALGLWECAAVTESPTPTSSEQQK